ncbi:MAG: hypothetical protein KDK12_08830 [Rhodobacteraceae bacterium]|nr:hypothetical protein [Paracoccaceae bacterium]
MFTRLAFVLFLIATPFAARAWTEDVRCVQAQLNAAGRDAGPVDGIVGPRTLAALQAQLAVGGVTGGHDLTRDTAATWCRRLGQADPALRAFWPSRSNPVIVRTGESVDPVLGRLIRVRLPSLHRQVAETLGVELSATDRVFVGSSIDELRTMILESHDHRPIYNLDGALNDHCREGDRIGAFATPGVMVVCVQQGTRLRIDLDYSTLVFVLTHEATHLVQFQMTGLPQPRIAPDLRVRYEGPMWLLEGLADVMGHSIAYRAEPAEVRALAARRYDGRDLPYLGRLQTRVDLLSRQADVYRAGMLASAILVEARGFAAAGRVFSLMGEGREFAGAFYDVYGRTPVAFYAAFPDEARPQGTPSGPAITNRPPKG